MSSDSDSNVAESRLVRYKCKIGGIVAKPFINYLAELQTWLLIRKKRRLLLMLALLMNCFKSEKRMCLY